MFWYPGRALCDSICDTLNEAAPPKTIQLYFTHVTYILSIISELYTLALAQPLHSTAMHTTLTDRLQPIDRFRWSVFSGFVGMYFKARSLLFNINFSPFGRNDNVVLFHFQLSRQLSLRMSHHAMEPEWARACFGIHKMRRACRWRLVWHANERVASHRRHNERRMLWSH